MLSLLCQFCKILQCEKKPNFIFIAAAKVGGIHHNNIKRAEFIYENLTIQNNIIHSSYKNDIKNLMNKVEDTKDQAAIIHSCKVFYKLYGDIFRSLDSDHGVPKVA